VILDRLRRHAGEADAPPGPAPVQTPIVELPERPVDLVLVATLAGLLVLGVLEVFSASAVYAMKKHGDSTYFLVRHLIYLGLGLVALLTGAVMDYRILQRRAYPLLLAAFALLVAVLLFGSRVNGARRWFLVGPLSFQPVEFAKLALISYLACSLTRKAHKVRRFAVGFAPHLVVGGLMAALVLKQPDMGSATILGITTLSLLFVAGTKISFLAGAVLATAPIAYDQIVATPWRLKRFMAFFNPEAFSQTVAYQIIQSLIAIGSGGITGVGLGAGRQQLGYMPEGHSDFILASIGEELGFVGVAGLLLLFALLLWRGLRAAFSAREAFGSYLAFGITVTLVTQAFINIGVALGSLPAKGITLPFVSYGGTSLIMSMFLAGLLLGVGRRTPPRPAGRRQLVNIVVGARRRKRKAVIVCGS
jgi:cell division protein FtsW